MTILRLAQMAGVRFDAHYNNTTVDPPELVRFIREQHPEVERHRPEMSMFRLILKNGWAPSRQMRWCCEDLKETMANGEFVVTGIRWEESVARRRRGMIDTCNRSNRPRAYLHPIIDWTSEDVWQFIRRENVPYCSLYDEGFTRLGCILCPMETNPVNIQRQMERWPKFVKAYINTFDKLIRVRAERGKSTTFKTGQEMFDWWIDRRKKTRQSDAQMTLFE